MRVNGLESPELIDKKELAKRLNAPSTRFVDGLMVRGVIPYLRLGYRTVRFDWIKVQTAIARHEVTGSR
jgi:hypothetical protein